MPSTYSPSLRLELIGAGEQAANWNNTTNYNLGTLLEQAIAGVQSVAVSGASYTLTTGSGVADEARNAVLVLTGTLAASCNVIVPTADKTYTFRNATTGGFSVVVKTAAGSGVTIANGFTQQVYCDATNVVAAGVPFNAATNTITTNVSGNVAAGAGSAATPSVTFGDADTGVYGPTVNELGFSANGTEVLRLSASALSYISGSNSINLTTDGAIEITRNGGGGYIDIKSAAGEDADVRILETSNGIGFQTGGNGALATRMVINSTGQIQSVGSGTAAAPAYSFSGDTDTGIYNAGANSLDFTASGERIFNLTGAAGSSFALIENATGGLYSALYMRVKDASGTVARASFLATSNENFVPVSAIIQNVATDGSSNIILSATPAGSRASDRRVDRVTIPGSGAISLTGDVDVAGNLRFNSGYGSAALAYGVRAWVNFNGTGTVAIRGSGGLTSITDNGTGDYTANYNFTLPDTNYVVVFGGTSANGRFTRVKETSSSDSNPVSKTTTAVRIFHAAATSDPADCADVNLAIVR